MITPWIRSECPELQDIQQGLMHLFILHTSASLMINENADPDVAADLEDAFDRMAPDGHPSYRHIAEGPDDMSAHIKSALQSTELTLPIRAGQLALGTWQGIFLCEHRDRAHPAASQGFAEETEGGRGPAEDPNPTGPGRDRPGPAEMFGHSPPERRVATGVAVAEFARAEVGCDASYGPHLRPGDRRLLRRRERRERAPAARDRSGSRRRGELHQGDRTVRAPHAGADDGGLGGRP